MPKTLTKKLSSSKYTVVGYYADNLQPWVQHVSSTDPHQAAATAVKKLETETGPHAQSPYVVEVFEGRLYGCLGNDSCIQM
jgi:hypothetical protein